MAHLPSQVPPKHRMTHSERRQFQDEQRARKAASLMTRACEIVLVRHGETSWNEEGRLQGQLEPGPPLDNLGMQQAAVVAQVIQQRYPHVDAVFSSDLLRAVQTAEVVAAMYGLKVQLHKGLRERNMGLLQGLTYAEAPHVEPEAWAAIQSDDSSTQLPGGESLDELKARLTAAVLDVARAHPGQRVIVVSHGGALHSLHKAARGYQAKGKVFNCSISVLLADADDSGGCSKVEPQQGSRETQRSHWQSEDVSAGSMKVLAADDDQVTMVWCDFADLCHHCRSSNSSSHGSAALQHTTHVDGGLCEGTFNGLCSDGYQVAAVSDTADASQEQAAAEGSSASLSGQSSKLSRTGKGGSSMRRCGAGKVEGGRLALMSWNDGCALEQAHLQSDKAFGGSSRAG